MGLTYADKMLEQLREQLVNVVGDIGPAVVGVDAESAIKNVLRFVREAKINLGLWFNPGTTCAVKTVLGAYIGKPKRIRLFYGDPATGRDWLETDDVQGRVGVSTGVIKAPLLFEKNDPYGSMILTDNIVRILDEETGAELYRHPRYHQPRLGLARREGKYEVTANSEVVGSFDESVDAAKHLAFLLGIPD